MNRIIKNILKQIEDNGFEAYLVGGFVRDYLLGIESFDIDICTNALPKDIYNIFGEKLIINNYGGVKFQIKNYNIDITTFRNEKKYVNRRPVEVIYVDNLKEDIIRRDFTINSICMDKNEKIIDLLDGVNDLNNKKIKMLGNIKERLVEDPLRILRAIRFASVLDFDIDSNLLKELKDNYELVNKLSINRIRQELDKILLNKNFKKGLKLLEECQILKLLQINYDNNMIYVNDLSGMWAQLETTNNFTFTKQELTNIINIRNIIKKGNIDNKIVYSYGLYISLVAGELLGIDKKTINKIANKLPIKSSKDLALKDTEIIELLNILPSSKIKDIKNELIDLVLDRKIKNNKDELKKYILTRKEM